MFALLALEEAFLSFAAFQCVPVFLTRVFGRLSSVHALVEKKLIKIRRLVKYSIQKIATEDLGQYVQGLVD